jgi:hypothetical protein
MDKTHRGVVLTFTVLGGLGGLACILQWLGIEPGDLHMTATIPHVVWLVLGLLLFGVSISLSILSWRDGRKTIAEAIVPEREEIKRVKEDLYNSARSNLEYRGERDRCEEEKRALQKRFDEMFSPLQIEAIELSRDILEYLKDFGLKPPTLNPGTPENRARICERAQWLERLMAGYQLRFEQRDKDISLKFQEKGMRTNVASEPRFMEDKYHQWAEELIALAYKIDGINLSVGEFR